MIMLEICEKSKFINVPVLLLLDSEKQSCLLLFRPYFLYIIRRTFMHSRHVCTRLPCTSLTLEFTPFFRYASHFLQNNIFCSGVNRTLYLVDSLRASTTYLLLSSGCSLKASSACPNNFSIRSKAIFC